MSYIVAILSCESNADRLNAVQDTWVRDLPSDCRVLSVFSRPGTPSCLDGNNLYLDCPDSYETLPKKVIELYKFVDQNLEFDYLFKCDDDTLVDVDGFLKLDLQNKDYIGNFAKDIGKSVYITSHYGKCSDKTLEVPYQRVFKAPWARGGRGYFLSKKAVGSILKNFKEEDLKELMEDKMIGEILSRDDEISRLELDKNEIPSLHPIQATEMYAVYKLQKEVRKLHLATEKLESEKSEAEERNRALENKRKVFEEELAKKKEQLRASQERVRELEDKKGEQLDQIAKLKESKKEQLDQISRLKEKKEEQLEQIARLKEKKNKQQKQIETLKDDKEALQNKLEDIRSELDSIKSSSLYKISNAVKKMWSRGGSNP